MSPVWRSMSTRATVWPDACAARASWMAATVAPTPPLEPVTVTTVPPGPVKTSLAEERWRRTPVDHWAAAWTRLASSS